MALIVPLAMFPFSIPARNAAGELLSGGSIRFFLPGTTTDSTVYHDVNGDAAWTNPVVCDATGYAQIFASPTLYDVVFADSDGVQQYTIEGWGDPGQIVFASLGNTLSQGSKAVATGYAILSTDNLVTTATGASAATLQLPAASTRSTANNGNGLPLTIMNFLGNTCSITPAGSDTINGDNAALVLVAAVSPAFPWVTLYSDGESAWYGLVK